MKHPVEVVVVSAIDKHPNADNLGITRVGKYQVVVRLGEFTPGDLAAFIPPESLVPLCQPEFLFLVDPSRSDRTHVRIGAKRLRKEWSEGLLVPARPGWVAGQDVAFDLGVMHYEVPPTTHLPISGATQTPAVPPGEQIPEYGVEAYRKYYDLLRDGEVVIITEKIHGCNARFTYRNGRFYAGSHRVWRRPADPLHPNLQWLRRIWPSKRGPGCNRWWALPPRAGDVWTRTLDSLPQLQAYLIAHPGEVVYGEIYGDGIQDMKYGCKDGEQKFAAFDILGNLGWLPQAIALDFLKLWGVPIVPTLFLGQLDHSNVTVFADGLSAMPNTGHLREGCVVQPIIPRTDTKVGGRVIMKIVSRAYLERGL